MDFNYRRKVNNSRFEFGLLEKFNFSTFCWPKANPFVSIMKPFNSCKQVSCRHSAVFLLCLVDSSPKISALRNSTFMRAATSRGNRASEIIWSETAGKRQFTACPTLIINPKHSTSLVTENPERLQSSDHLTTERRRRL